MVSKKCKCVKCNININNDPTYILVCAYCNNNITCIRKHRARSGVFMKNNTEEGIICRQCYIRCNR